MLEALAEERVAAREADDDAARGDRVPRDRVLERRGERLLGERGERARREAARDDGVVEAAQRLVVGAARRVVVVVRRLLALVAERLCPGNPGVFRVFPTWEASISVAFQSIRLLLGPLIISARVLEI